MSSTAQVLAAASDLLAVAPDPGTGEGGGGGAGGIRGGFQDVFLAFSAALAVIALWSRKVSVMGICLLAWLLGLMFAFTPESGMEAIGGAVGSIAEWIITTIDG